MLNHLKIRSKLVLLVGTLILFIAAVGAISERAFSTGRDSLATIFNDRVVPLRDLKVIADMYAVNVVDTAHKTRGGSLNRPEAIKNIQQARGTVRERWDAYLATYLVEREQQLVAQLKPRLLVADQAVERLLLLLESGSQEDLENFVDHQMYPAIDPVAEKLSALIDLQIEVADQTTNSTVARFDASRNQIIGLIGAAIVLGLLAGWWIIRSVTRPLAQACEAIQRLAAGDLSVNVEDSGWRDETGQMLRATAQIVETLRAVSHDLGELIEAARAGTLSVRADPGRHQGEFSRLISSANALLGALAEPLHEVAAVMARLAAGDVRGRMTGDYAGELRALKGNVNRSLDVLVSMLDAISACASALAQGDLTCAIEGSFQGEFAAMKLNLNQAVSQLRGVLVEVRQATAQVTLSASETTAAAVEVSRHAAGQMTTLVDISGAIEQTGAAIGEIARHADQARLLARQAQDSVAADQATLASLGDAVQVVAERTARIASNSERIGGIADKTYVLALNAGLEAARAKEHGAGFGQIAQQITALAEEVASATRDIRGLVEEAGTAVGTGLQTAAEARSAMGRLVQKSADSGDAVQSIAASIEEQSAMMQLLRERVVQLQTVAQTTASASEEISATMQAMTSMAQHLHAETDRIRTA